MDIVSSFDAEKFFLGKLCKHGHDWQSTGHSLRYIKFKKCVSCQVANVKQDRQKHKEARSAKSKEWYQANKKHRAEADRDYRTKNADKIRQYQQEYRAKNIDRIKERDRDYNLRNREKRSQYFREYKLQNPEKVRLKNKRYREQNREKIRQSLSRWYKNNRDYMIDYQRRYTKENAEKLKALGRIKNRRRRAKKKNNHFIVITKEQLQCRFEEFNNCCAYCQQSKHLTADHFIAIANGGSDTLGNIVPACQGCNFSKQDKDPLRWFEAQPFFSQKQWKQILRILGKVESTYSQIPLL